MQFMCSCSTTPLRLVKSLMTCQHDWKSVWMKRPCVYTRMLQGTYVGKNVSQYMHVQEYCKVCAEINE